MPFEMARLWGERPPEIIQLNSDRAQNDPGGYFGPWYAYASFHLGT